MQTFITAHLGIDRDDRPIKPLPERAQQVTRARGYTQVEYARFADDLVVLVDGHPRHAWLGPAVRKR